MSSAAVAAPEMVAMEAAAPARLGYSVELYFDPASRTKSSRRGTCLRAARSARSSLRLPPPHITLFSSPSIDPARFLPAVRSLAARLEPLPVSLSSVHHFPAAAAAVGFSFWADPDLGAARAPHTALRDAAEGGVEAAEEFRPIRGCHTVLWQ
ncbi:hypothetical protein IEQ34_011892 [Dendrobium chrysotoxum]|uniref:Uncharacterized protein n=1 Tax=Dendrobium chrysotoxum TaxID=161865 RepID=A0AAV7GTX7_DENCH|nr:hypothetical protein IEQ34_011892 [Dendrobium chrysotoxum]